MILKIGYDSVYKKQTYNNMFRQNLQVRNRFNDYDCFVSFSGAEKNSQKEKIGKIMLYTNSPAKKLINELREDALKDGYDSITTAHVLRYFLNETLEYVNKIESGELNFDKEELPAMPLYLSGNISPTMFSDKELRKKIIPVIEKNVKDIDEYIKDHRPDRQSSKKNITFSDEMIDNIWSFRKDETDVISPTVIFCSAVYDDNTDLYKKHIGSFAKDLCSIVMINSTPKDKRRPFSEYEDLSKVMLKKLSLGTNLFLTYDINKDEPDSFIDTFKKVAEANGKTKIIQLNDNATNDFVIDMINKVKNDRDHDYIFIANPMAMIINFTDAENIMKSLYSVPPVVSGMGFELPPNVKLLFCDTKNNYYTFGDAGKYSRFQEVSIPSLKIEQMVKYFKENSDIVKELGVQFSKGAIEKVVIASAQMDGAFPSKTVDLFKKIKYYNSGKTEITEKDVNEFIKEATDMLKKSNDDTSVDIVFDTGKHLKQLYGRLGTRKEAENIVRQIKAKKLGTKGLIVYSEDGTPGSGRKFIAKAIAGDAKIPYIEINTMDFGTKDVDIFGSDMSPEKSMKKLFSMVCTQAEANPKKSAVLFVENFEYFSIGEMVSAYHQKAMAQLLREMEKAQNKGLNILVVGSMSNPELMGEAAMKSLKFSDKLAITSPVYCKEDRIEILKNEFKNQRLKLPKDKEERENLIKYAGDITIAFPNIYLKNLTNKIKEVAEERRHKVINKSDITEAYLQITTGRVVSNNDPLFGKQIVASHECGHATNLEVMNNLAKTMQKPWHIPQKVNFVTLDPRGMYGGAVYHGRDINSERTFEYMFSNIVCCYGGNSAENRFYGIDGSYGITCDMESAKNTAETMVKTCAMGPKTGKIAIFDNEDLSNNMKQMIEDDERVILNNARITSDLITEIYEDFNKEFTEKYSQKVGTGDCIIDGDEFRKALNDWKSKQSPEKQKEIKECDKVILEIIEATKRGIAVQKKY